MAKDEARAFLNDWLKNHELPISNCVVYSKQSPGLLEEYTFLGLIEIIYK